MALVVTALLLQAPDWTSNDAVLRLAAIEKLTYPQSVAETPVLMELAHDDDAGVRKAAIKKLGAWGRKGLNEFLAFLKNPQDPAHATFLDRAVLIGGSGDDEELSDFEILMYYDKAVERRTGAALAGLARNASDDLDAVCSRLVYLLQDKDDGVKQMAATSLALLGWGAIAEQDPVNKVAGLRIALHAEEEGMWFAGFALMASLRTSDSEAMALLEAPSKDPTFEHHRKRTLRKLRGPQGESAKRLGELKEWFAVFEKGGVWRAGLRAALIEIRELGPRAASLDKNVAWAMASANKDESVILVRAAEALVAISPDNAPRAAKKLTPFVKRTVMGEEDTRMRACLLLAKLGPPAYSALIDMLTWREPKVDRKIESDPVELRAKRAAARALGRADPLPAQAKPLLKRLVKHPDPVISYLAARALRARS